jgi:hypothetical protein
MGGNKNRGEKRGVALEPRTSQERPLFEEEGMSVGLSSSRVCKLKGGSHLTWKMRSGSTCSPEGSTFLPPLFDTVTREGKNR